MKRLYYWLLRFWRIFGRYREEDYGIYLSDASDVVIEGNYFATDPGNHGICLDGGSCDSNLIRGNKIITPHSYWWNRPKRRR